MGLCNIVLWYLDCIALCIRHRNRPALYRPRCTAVGNCPPFHNIPSPTLNLASLTQIRRRKCGEAGRSRQRMETPKSSYLLHGRF